MQTTDRTFRRRFERVAAGTALIAGLAVLATCNDSDGGTGITPPPPPPAQITVRMLDNVFDQRTDTVAVGGSVTWRNAGGIAHTTTSDAGLWDSGSMSTGATFARTFPTAGTFRYHCTFHGAPNGAGMAGTIVVR